MLVTLPSPISELQHTPLPLKVLQAKECAPILCFFVNFSLDSHLSPLKNLGVHHMGLAIFRLPSFNMNLSPITTLNMSFIVGR